MAFSNCFMLSIIFTTSDFKASESSICCPRKRFTSSVDLTVCSEESPIARILSKETLIN